MLLSQEAVRVMAPRRSGYTSVETHGLRPGAVWRFRAPVRDKRTVHYVLGKLRYGIGAFSGSRSYHCG